MLKFQTKTFFAVAFVLSLVCVGCRSIPEPAFLTAKPNDNRECSKADQIKYKALSNESAELGWRFLFQYLNDSSFLPIFNKQSIVDSMDSFNDCWWFNNENYQAYWGSGVVRGVQATFVDDKTLIEKYLKQSVEFIRLAEKYNVPANQSNNLHLDLANAYNGLGAFYSQTSREKLAEVNLEQARILLLDVIKKEPKNGRAFYLLAVTSFYQRKFEESKKEADQALNKHFKVPDDFLKDLSNKLKNAAPSVKANSSTRQ